MKKIIAAILITSAVAIPVIAQLSSREAAGEEAREIADVIRDFNQRLGGVVEGELSPQQIDAFEKMITPALDVDKQHAAFCSMEAFGAAGKAGLMIGWEKGIRVSTIPEITAEMTESLAQAKAEIVPGSMRDWLLQYSQSLITTLGFDRTVAAAKFECLQHPYAHAMYADIPMNSNRMRVEEKCLIENICED